MFVIQRHTRPISGIYYACLLIMLSLVTNNTAEDLLQSYGCLYPAQQSCHLLEDLIEEIDWQTEFVAYGRKFELPRLQAWYADKGVHYRNSDNKMQTRDWVSILSSIKSTIDSITNHTFNSVLLTYYRNGQDFVGWHADDEPELGSTPVIASLSLGATRTFHYRHKQTACSGSMPLHDGELLVMQPAFQQHWEHCLLPEAQITQPRLNLTFRRVVS